MNAIIFTSSHHILANYIIKKLFSNPNLTIVGIVESDVVYPGKGKLESLFFMIKKSGARYVASQIIKFLYFHIGSTCYGLLPKKSVTHLLYSYHAITDEKKIPIFRQKNVNTPEFVDRMRTLKPDLFISIFFNQIFKHDILSVPKNGTINLHPALLPSYRGLSPTFWVLANGEKSTGITVHRVDSEAIDAGQILAQVRVPIRAHDTEYSLYWRCIRLAMPILRRSITSIARNQISYVKPNGRVKPSYFSLPQKSDVDRFLGRGRKFLTLSQLMFPPEF